MKKSVLLLFISLFSFSLTQCNPEDSDDSTPESESVSYKYENENVVINSWTAIKNGDRFVITAMGDEQTFAIEFNEYGNLSSANSYPNIIGGVPFSRSFAMNSSYFFNFNLTNDYTENKMVAFNFDGVLHENEYSVESNTHSVEGSFTVNYTEVEETDLSALYCKINSQDWHATSVNSIGVNNVTLNNYSDNEYIIGVSFNTNSTPLVTNHSFEDSSVLKIELATYDPATDNYVEYNTSGIISITSFTAAAYLSYGFIEGSFSFTATHPTTGSTITVSNGTFKQYFQ